MKKSLERLSIIACLGLLYYSLCFPLSIYYMVGIILLMTDVLITNHFKIRINIVVFLVFLFSIVFFTLESFLNYSNLAKITYGGTIILMAFVGYNWSSFVGDKLREKNLIQSIRIVYYGLALFVFLCVGYSFTRNGMTFIMDREPLIIWDGSVGVSTHLCTISAVPMAAATYEMIAFRERRLHTSFISFGMLVCNILLSNRMGMVLYVAFLTVSTFIVYKDSKRSKKINFFVCILTFAFLFISFYTLDIGGIQEKITKLPVVSRTIMLRQSGYSEPRVERQLYIIKNFYTHMSGGGYFNQEIGESHNVWLDIYDFAGMVPFLFFTILTIWVIKKMIIMLKKSNNYNNLLFMVLFAFLFTFIEEPVMRSSDSFFSLYFIFIGITARLSKMKCLKD